MSPSQLLATARINNFTACFHRAYLVSKCCRLMQTGLRLQVMPDRALFPNQTKVKIHRLPAKVLKLWTVGQPGSAFF